MPKETWIVGGPLSLGHLGSYETGRGQFAAGLIASAQRPSEPIPEQRPGPGPGPRGVSERPRSGGPPALRESIQHPWRALNFVISGPHEENTLPKCTNLR